MLASSQSPTCTVGWADTAGEHGRIDLALPLVASALENWPAELDDIWGPAAQDYFRLKLGVWYADTGQTELARKSLESVRDRPANPDFSMASRLAAAYLSGYGENADAAAGCLAIRDAVYEGVWANSGGSLWSTYQKVQESWGFIEPDLGWFCRDGSPCSAIFCEPEPLQ